MGIRLTVTALSALLLFAGAPAAAQTMPLEDFVTRANRIPLNPPRPSGPTLGGWCGSSTRR